MCELSVSMAEKEGATELETLIKIMESVSPTCSVSISPIRHTHKVSLWWTDQEKFFNAIFSNTKANLHNPAFSHALQDAKLAMN